MSIHRSTVRDDVASRIGVRIGVLGALALGTVALGAPDASAGDLVTPPVITDPDTPVTPADPDDDGTLPIDVCLDLDGIQLDVGDCPDDPEPTTPSTPAEPTTPTTPSTPADPDDDGTDNDGASPVDPDDDVVVVNPGDDASGNDTSGSGSTPSRGSAGSATVNVDGSSSTDASDSTVDVTDAVITPVGGADTGDGSYTLAPTANGADGDEVASMAVLGVAAVGAAGALARWRSRGRHRATAR